MALTNHIIRRIFLADELQKIERMQVNAKEFVDHYPHHRELKMALKEVLDGNRVAFGVFKYGFNTQKEHSYEIVGSIILKKNPYSRIIHLKNFFIKEDERGQKYGAALYEEAENFSNRTGFELISTEVPFSEIRTINFLHKRGYVIVSTTESRFKQGDLIYTMEKSLTPCYSGDPFDIQGIGQWILSIFYKLTIFETNRNISFCNLPVDSQLTKEGCVEKLRIKGAAFFLEDTSESSVNELIRLAENNRYLIVFCRMPSIDIVDFCSDKLIPLIDGFSIKEQFSKNTAIPLFPFSFFEIAGMIVAIKSSLFKRINQKGYDSFVYYKGGPTGKYLKAGDTIALYSEFTEEDPNEGLKGIAEISSLICAPPDEAWKFSEGRNRLFEKPEFDRFVATKDIVIGMELKGFREIEQITLQEINKILFGGKEISWEIGHTYLSSKTVQLLKKHRNLMKTTNYHVAISFAGENRGVAEKLAKTLQRLNVKVFYDQFEQDDLWGKDLYQYFQVIFRDEADFSIPIISVDYSRKIWTSHELKQMQARSFKEKREYILPLRLDDTEVPGINDTTGFIDLRKVSIDDVANAVVKKLKSFGFIH